MLSNRCGRLATHDEEEALQGPSPDCCAKSPAIISLQDHACHLNHRFMQLLPRGMQELPPKEKPHRSSSWTSKSCYRCGSPGFGLGDPTSGRLECCVTSCLERSASIRPSPETPDGYRNRDPRKDHYANVRCKNPSAATNKEKSSERRHKIERAHPAGTALLQPTLLPPRQLQQRAGLKGNFANSTDA